MIWYVAFADDPTDAPDWWKFSEKLRHLFVKPGFEHVMAYRQLDLNQLLFVEPTKACLSIHVGPGWVHDVHERLWAGHDATIMAVESGESSGMYETSLRTMTCASVMSYILGLEKHPIGPVQLYELLRQRGARQLERSYGRTRESRRRSDRRRTAEGQQGVEDGQARGSTTAA